MNNADADAAKTDLEACEEEGPSGYIKTLFKMTQVCF